MTGQLLSVIPYPILLWVGRKKIPLRWLIETGLFYFPIYLRG
jgi:hypothetical protein